MSTKFQDKITPITREELIPCLWQAWLKYFDAPPKKESIWVLVAQIILETGGKSCHNFNLGNVKSREGDGHDYCFFACNEILNTTTALKLQTASPTTAKVTKTLENNRCIIWFYPEHPACRFRAFGSLVEGAADHLILLVKRFQKAWPSVLAGDPAAYAHALKLQGYYTADESQYARSVTSIFKSLSKLPIDYDSMPVISDAERERIEQTIALSLNQLAADEMSEMSDSEAETKPT